MKCIHHRLEYQFDEQCPKCVVDHETVEARTSLCSTCEHHDNGQCGLLNIKNTDRFIRGGGNCGKFIGTLPSGISLTANKAKESAKQDIHAAGKLSDAAIAELTAWVKSHNPTAIVSMPGVASICTTIAESLGVTAWIAHEHALLPMAEGEHSLGSSWVFLLSHSSDSQVRTLKSRVQEALLYSGDSYGDAPIRWCAVSGKEAAFVHVQKDVVEPVVATATPGPKKPSSDKFFIDAFTANDSMHAEDVTIASTHFNWAGFKNTVDKVYRWVPTLGPLRRRLDFIEAKHGPVGEIDFSREVDATVDMLLWQKEPMLNIALRDCKTEFFAWLDNDIVIEDVNWLDKSIELLNSGCPAVQLFSTIKWLDADDRVEVVRQGSVDQYLATGTWAAAPGGCWIARTSMLRKIGGFPSTNVVGCCDQDFFFAMAGIVDYGDLNRGDTAYARALRDWTDRARAVAGGRLPGRLKCSAAHIWHGEGRHRDYVGRRELVKGYGVDPYKHTEIAANGLLQWTDTAPAGIRESIAKHFEGRREDG